MNFLRLLRASLIALLLTPLGCAMEDPDAPPSEASSLTSAPGTGEAASTDAALLPPHETLESLSFSGSEGCVACRPGPIPWHDHRLIPVHED